MADYCLLLYTNKTDRHDITEILMKVELNTITHPNLYCVICISTNNKMRANLFAAMLNYIPPPSIVVVGYAGLTITTPLYVCKKCLKIPKG